MCEECVAANDPVGIMCDFADETANTDGEDRSPTDMVGTK